MTTKPEPPAKKPTTASSVAKDKMLHLEAATNNLTRSVERLTTVVSQNNREVNTLREQVYEKADHAEVIDAKIDLRADRLKAFRRAIGVALVAALTAGTISYFLAKREVNDRIKAGYIACERNNERAMIDANVFGDVAKIIPVGPVRTRLVLAQRDLMALQADCRKLHPYKGELDE